MRPNRNRLDPRIWYRVASCPVCVLTAASKTAASILFGRLRLKWRRGLEIARHKAICCFGTCFLSHVLMFSPVFQAPFATRKKSVSLLNEARQFGITGTEEERSSSPKETACLGQLLGMPDLEPAMGTYRSAVPCIPEQVIENGFHVALCRPHLYNFGDSATFHLVDKPPDEPSRCVSQGNSTQIPVRFHLSHEIQQPT